MGIRINIIPSPPSVLMLEWDGNNIEEFRQEFGGLHTFDLHESGGLLVNDGAESLIMKVGEFWSPATNQVSDGVNIPGWQKLSGVGPYEYVVSDS